MVFSKVCEELIKTEESYVGVLQIIDGIHTDLQEDHKGISESEIEIMFGAVRALYNLHKTFLDNLKSGQDISDVFTTYSPFMKMYTSYLTNYERALEIISANENNRKFQALIKKIRSEHNTTLPSLLINPIQRVPRYVLLLNEIIKYSDKSDASYAKLEKSRDEIKKIADHINEAQRHVENISKIITLQDRVGLELVQPHRRFVHEGHVRHFSQKHMKDSCLFLFTDMLMWTSTKYKLKDTIDLAGVSVNTVSKTEFCLSSEEKLGLYFSFDCETIEERDQWVKDIKKCIQKLGGRGESDAQIKKHQRRSGNISGSTVDDTGESSASDDGITQTEMVNGTRLHLINRLADDQEKATTDGQPSDPGQLAAAEVAVLAGESEKNNVDLWMNYLLPVKSGTLRTSVDASKLENDDETPSEISLEDGVLDTIAESTEYNSEIAESAENISEIAESVRYDAEPAGSVENVSKAAGLVKDRLSSKRISHSAETGTPQRLRTEQSVQDSIFERIKQLQKSSSVLPAKQKIVIDRTSDHASPWVKQLSPSCARPQNADTASVAFAERVSPKESPKESPQVSPKMSAKRESGIQEPPAAPLTLPTAAQEPSAAEVSNSKRVTFVSPPENDDPNETAAVKQPSPIGITNLQRRRSSTRVNQIMDMLQQKSKPADLQATPPVRLTNKEVSTRMKELMSVFQTNAQVADQRRAQFTKYEQKKRGGKRCLFTAASSEESKSDEKSDP
eukprot:700654_1